LAHIFLHKPYFRDKENPTCPIEDLPPYGIDYTHALVQASAPVKAPGIARG